MNVFKVADVSFFFFSAVFGRIKALPSDISFGMGVLYKAALHLTEISAILKILKSHRRNGGEEPENTTHEEKSASNTHVLASK